MLSIDGCILFDAEMFKTYPLSRGSDAERKVIENSSGAKTRKIRASVGAVVTFL